MQFPCTLSQSETIIVWLGIFLIGNSVSQRDQMASEISAEASELPTPHKSSRTRPKNTEMDEHGKEEYSFDASDISPPENMEESVETQSIRESLGKKTVTGKKRGRDSDSDSESDSKVPKTLEELGYVFNSEGRLREKESGKPFTFVDKESDHNHNQKRYEDIGEAVTKYVYDLLQREANLKKVMIPVDPEGDEPQSFFFMSENAQTNPDKLMLILHGSGVVRAGQWARRLIINDCLDSGTQLPYIKRALNEGYDVMVLNTNLNYVTEGAEEGNERGVRRNIRENSSPEEHAIYIWRNFVREAKARHIAIVAHSYGGVVTVELANRIQNEKKRIFAIALTDSVHSFKHQVIPETVATWMKKVARNWVSHRTPLDTPVQSFNRPEVERVSAGHEKHEMTSWSSFTSVFKFLEEKYEAVTNKTGKLKNGASKNDSPKNGGSKNDLPKNIVPPQASKEDL